jgi:multidrug efflux pump subunit AcrA (membrane-fusion protein)
MTNRNPDRGPGKESDGPPVSKPPSSLFRAQALQHAASAGRTEGDVLRLSPSWTRWAYWILVTAFAMGLVFCVFGTMYEYATGPAVVWVTGRTELTSPVSSTVRSIEARPGQRVEVGAVLVRFHAAREEAELDRIRREFDLELVKTLRDPSDQEAKRTLTSLRAQIELAAARLEELSLRAPRAGVIGDVRIRPGQLIEAGDIVLSLIDEDPRCSIVAMLPAHYRPQLRPGMTLRFEVTGYRYAYQELVIESVAAQIIGPAEVKRYLGQEIADTVAVSGPVVLVEARLVSPTFRVDERSFEFFHGMNGVAEARVRKERLLVAMFPSLRVLLDRIGE